jgi:hypothetical protein
MHLMEAGAYRLYDGEGRVSEEVAVAPPVSEFPMTFWVEPHGPHALHGLGSRPWRLLLVELKARRARSSPRP